MKTQKKWTEEEKQMLRDGLPVADVAKKTGRSFEAVLSKLYHMGLKRNRYGYEPEKEVYFRDPPGKHMSQFEKELRIRELANKFRIKIGG